MSDVPFELPIIRVQRALSTDGEEHSPKGRRNRTVPMTSRLVEALRAYVRDGAGEGDVPAHVIQELAGHADLKTTARYLHVRERQAHAAIQKFEQRSATRQEANATGSRDACADPNSTYTAHEKGADGETPSHGP
jgi:integrase